MKTQRSIGALRAARSRAPGHLDDSAPNRSPDLQIRHVRPGSPPLRSALAAGAIAAGLAGPALGDIATWTGSSFFDEWEDASNWSTNAVPGPLDTARFFNPGTIRSIDTDGAETFDVGRLLLEGGVHTFTKFFDGQLSLNAVSFDPLLPSVEIGGGDEPTLIGERFALTAVDVVVGPTSPRPGILELAFDETSIIASGVTVIGDDGRGTLRVGGGSSYAGLDLVAGRDGGGDGTIDVQSDGVLSLSDVATIGAAGDGLLTMGFSGQFDAQRLILGRDRGATGTAQLFGDGTVVTIAEWCDIGQRGVGQVDLVAGASLTIGQGCTIGTFLWIDFFDPPEGAGAGALTIRDPGTSVSIGGDLWIGLLGSGAVTLDSRSSLVVGGDVTTATVAPAEDARLTFELAPNGSPSAALQIDGAMDSVPIVLAFEPGTIPAIGSTWHLIETGAGFGTPSLELPPPLPDATWQVDQTAAGLSVSLVSVGAEADVNGDGAVDFTDLLQVLSAWGDCPGCPEDLDGDGVVGFGDVLVVLSQWTD